MLFYTYLQKKCAADKQSSYRQSLFYILSNSQINVSDLEATQKT